mmetsp:Transcript_38864/g.39550  ORF Transcript_38864/g.39550 Transcript_38864/m.39550 type:complete len:88 (+) Transcript_38864:67-330(+)
MIVCWKCVGGSLNVMCPKIDIQAMKHQLEALGVLRPKIIAPKLYPPSSSSSPSPSCPPIESNKEEEEKEREKENMLEREEEKSEVQE